MLKLIILLLIMYYVVCYQVDYFSQSDPVLQNLRAQLSTLDPRLQNIELYVANKSYTINKKRIYICLKDKNGEYYDRNMLSYVVLHEYAHILCPEIGHTKHFFDVFNTLLQKATKRGLYNPNIPPLKDYCGHN